MPRANYDSTRASPVISGKKRQATIAIRNATPKRPNNTGSPNDELMTGTSRGADMAATRPNAVADPLPVPRIDVG